MVEVVNFGCGVQSTAMLVLASRGFLPKHFIFADVGEHSEHPSVHKYLREYAMPFAEDHGIQLDIVSTGDIFDTIMETEASRELIPVRMSRSQIPGKRTCTCDYKIKPIHKHLALLGATPENPATTCLGISLDEARRRRTKSGCEWVNLRYPLLDLLMSREKCKEIIGDAGLPVPGKSACWFCPFHSVSFWQDLRKHDPEHFWKAVELERYINERRREYGRDGDISLCSRGGPLDVVIPEDKQLELFPELVENGCESGYCFM